MRTPISSLIGTLVCFAWIVPAAAEPAGLEKKLEELQHQNELLQQQGEMLRRQSEMLQREMHDVRVQLQRLEAERGQARAAVDPQRPEPAVEGPKVSFGGQYRINSYVVNDDVEGDDRAASRLRARQNIDIAFDESFKTHLQLELGHTTDNVTTTSSSSRSTEVDVRHAVLDYTFSSGTNVQAGIVPLSDRFGDMLFSSDWDYNPLAGALTLPAAGGSLRAFIGNLGESDETVSEDDFLHYQLDYAAPLTAKSEVNVGASVLNLPDPSQKDRYHANFGIGSRYHVSKDVLLQGLVVGSFTEQALLATADDGKGFAAKIELVAQNGLGLMATYASGESDGSGFLPPMALARTNGYWGYTGLLTIQGPTDTGFDADSVNVSNNGHGLTTVQVKYARPLSSRLDLYLGAGWFGNTDAPGGRDSTLGFDFLGMGTYHLTEILAFDFGVAHALLQDSVSGYANGVVGGRTFNDPPGQDRSKSAIFTRLQAQF